MEIKEFDLSDIPRWATITIIASRRSGKSVLTRHILYKELIKKRKIDNIVIVSPTLHNGDYDWLSDKYKFTEFDEPFLDKILARQEELVRTDKDGNHDLVLILDDIVKSTDAKTKDILSRLYTLSRHYHLYVILISQSLRHELTPIIKFNSDVVAIFRTRNFENKKEIADLWLGFSEKDSRDAGFQLIDEVAQGYRCLIIDNTVHSNEVNNICFHYEVPIDKSVPKNYYKE